MEPASKSLSRRQLLVAPLVLAPAWGQEPPTPTIRVDVRLIRTLVNVKDQFGQLVGRLDKKDFQIFDNGVEQEVAVFERSTSAPLKVAVLLDISASVAKDLKYETEATMRFARQLIGEGNEQDAIALFTFNHAVDIVAGFTRRLQRLENAMKEIRTGAGTSMYDALYLAGEELEGQDGRKVVILVSDGGDTASYKRFDAALMAAQRAQAAVYPLLVMPVKSDAGRNVGGENALQLIAERTGGRVLLPASYEKLHTAFEEVLQDLRSQYLLAYYPRGVESKKRNSFHKLEVKVKREGLRVQTRSGYYEETL